MNIRVRAILNANQVKEIESLLVDHLLKGKMTEVDIASYLLMLNRTQAISQDQLFSIVVKIHCGSMSRAIHSLREAVVKGNEITQEKILI